MYVREKLIELIGRTPCCGFSSSAAAEHIAVHLLENGVTIPVQCNDCQFSKLPSPAVQKYGVPGARVCGNGNSQCNHRLVLGTDYCPYGKRRADNA